MGLESEVKSLGAIAILNGKPFTDKVCVAKQNVKTTVTA